MSQNTKKKGMLRFFIYYDKKEKEFVGVCIDLGIIKCGDNPYYVEKDLTEAAMGYIETIGKENLPDTLLNQKPPQEYLDIFEKISNAILHRNVASRSTVDVDEARTFVRKVPAELCHAF